MLEEDWLSRGLAARGAKQRICPAGAESGYFRRIGCTPTGLAVMKNQEKIYVDASLPATLNTGTGVLQDCPTLQEAVVAWHRLAPQQKKRATVKVFGGPLYNADEIERLLCRPKPP